MNWRGRPLTSHEVILNTIASTTTSTGLKVEAALDPGSYPTGVQVSRQQLQALPITAHDRHGKWNYTITPAAGDTPGPQGADERVASRTRALLMLADPRLTGMTDAELASLQGKLAPDQEARREQRRYVLRGGRRVATTGRNRSLLSSADEVLVTVVYLRQVCPQKVLCDLLGINPVTIGQAIKATRQLLDEHKISITPTVVRYFTSAKDLENFIVQSDPEQVPMEPSRYALTAPALTGMTQPALHALLEELVVPYAAAIEKRRYRHRGGERRPGTRGGVFRQKITDADRILATILYLRRICTLEMLAELFDVSRSTLWNAINDVLPVLDSHGPAIAPAEHRFATAAELLASTPAKSA
jgi:hypothetical protein